MTTDCRVGLMLNYVERGSDCEAATPAPQVQLMCVGLVDDGPAGAMIIS